jgi:hypothetical protein
MTEKFSLAGCREEIVNVNLGKSIWTSGCYLLKSCIGEPAIAFYEFSIPSPTDNLRRSLLKATAPFFRMAI